jgi:adenylate cyclase
MLKLYAKKPDELLYCSKAIARIVGPLLAHSQIDRPVKHKSQTRKFLTLLDSPLIQVKSTLVYADLAESMYLYVQAEKAAIEDLRAVYKEIAEHVAPKIGARLIERVGDGFLFETHNAVTGARLAEAIHACASRHTTNNKDGRVFAFRIGLHTSETFADDTSVFGLGVNLVSRISAGAKPGQTHMSVDTASDLVDGIDVRMTDLGEHYFKHLPEPVRIFKCQATTPHIELSVAQRHTAFASRDALDDLKLAIAIVPFENYNLQDGNGVNAAVGLILADQLINNLSRSTTLRVISRHSSSLLRSRSADVDTFAKQMKVQYLVSGSFVSDGESLIVNYELRSVPNSNIVLSKQFIGKAVEILNAQSDANQSIASSISEHLFTHLTLRYSDQPLPTLPNHALLLTGMHYLNRLSSTNFQRAFEAFTELQDRVPLNPIPSAWLARWYVYKCNQGWSKDRTRDINIANGLINKSLDTNDQIPFFHTVLGQVQTINNPDLKVAEQSIMRAVALNPSDSLAWLHLGNVQSFSGRGKDALVSCERAISLSPIDPMRFFYLTTTSGASLAAGDYAAAERLSEESLRLNSTHHSSLRCLAIACSLLGKDEKAREIVRRILISESGLTVTTFIKNSPGRASGLAEKFGEALGRAGLPQ